MKRRLVITTEIISPYRIPVFNALAQHPNVDLHVIFLAETDLSMRRWKVYKNEIGFSYEVLPHWRRRVAGYNLLLNRGVTAALERARPDVIVCGGYGYLASWLVLAWARRHKRPLFLWSESNLQDQRRGTPLVEMLKRRFIGACSGFVVPGKSAAAYAATFGVPQERIFVAPNAVDNALFSQEAAAARTREAEMRRQFGLPESYFLCVGRLVSSKGVFDLLDAYSRLAPDLRTRSELLFVGDGVDQAELEARATTIHPGAARFTGFVHRELLAVYYALAEALVFPTHTDPWGLVVNEAMACGIPIVATDAGGCVADLVQDGWNGYVVPKGAPDKLAEALARVISSRDLNVMMGARSAQRVELNSPQACAAGFVAALDAAEFKAAEVEATADSPTN
jgi:glycosyltransferase involved in cell wall biosynthesis